MDRREQSEWTEAAADDVTDKRDSDLDPEEVRDEAAVAHRLSRVTRYATGAAAKSDPDQEERRESPSEETPRPDPAPAEEAQWDPLPQEEPPQEPPEPEDEDALEDAEPAQAVSEGAVLAEEAQQDFALAEEAELVFTEPVDPEPVLAEEAQPEPVADGDPLQTVAPPEEALQEPAAFEQEPPAPPPPETLPEEPIDPAIADPLGVEEPSPAVSNTAAPAASADRAEVVPAGEQPAPETLQDQEEGAPADPPEQPAPMAEAPAPEAETGPDDSEVLTVGRGIRLVAKLCECAELLVEGHLEATARTRQLQVAKSGRFIGSAEVEYAEVHGHYEGELTVSKKLYIGPTGSVSGTTHYREIAIESGGQIMGNTHHLPDEGAAGAEG